MLTPIVFNRGLVCFGKVFDCDVWFQLFQDFEDLVVGDDHVVGQFQSDLVSLFKVLQTVILTIFHTFFEYFQFVILIIHDLVHPTLNHKYLNHQIIHITLNQQMLNFLQLLQCLIGHLLTHQQTLQNKYSGHNLQIITVEADPSLDIIYCICEGSIDLCFFYAFADCAEEKLFEFVVGQPLRCLLQFFGDLFEEGCR